MCFVGRVGNGARCDAGREGNHDENRDSVCVLPRYAHRRVPCTTRRGAICASGGCKKRGRQVRKVHVGCECGLALNDDEPRLQASAASASA